MREMKDSGIEWIGEIPKGWNIYRNKNAFSCSKELVGKKFKETQLLSLTTKGIKLKDINNPEGKLPESFDTYQYVKKDEIVMCLFDLDCSAVFSGLSPYDGMISPAYKVLTCTTKMVPAYADYWFTYISYDRKFNHYAKNIRYTLNYEEFASLPMLFPSVEEQHRIADYLDKKCAKIDAIIEKQQEIIEKLKEYKLSVITEAVTKGLNPDVEMKDSGVDLCKTIPTHWKVLQNRYLFSLRDEKNYKPLEEVQLLSLYTDLGVFPHGEQEERGNKAVKAEGYKVVYEDDIIVNIILAWMGAIGRSAYSGVTSPAYDIYKPMEDVCSRYYHYLYRTKIYSGECYKYGRGIMAMRWRTYSSEFKSIKVPTPPYEEQVEIANYLDEKCELIDKTIEERQQAIDKLLDYKKSLIYEVVTGKKEV